MILRIIWEALFFLKCANLLANLILVENIFLFLTVMRIRLYHKLREKETAPIKTGEMVFFPFHFQFLSIGKENRYVLSIFILMMKLKLHLCVLME